MSYDEKIDILKKNKACFTCMKTGHRTRNCKTNVRCIVCGKRHYTIICPGLLKLERNPQSSSVEEKDNTSLFIQSKPEVLLQTLMVSIEVNKKRKVVRALFDTGSQRSYVLASTMDQMGAIAQRTEHLTHVVFGGLSSRKKHQCYKLLISNLRKSYFCDMQVLDQDVICGHVPSIERGPWLLELQKRGIDITDVGKSSVKIELLIGADYIGRFYTGNVLHSSGGLVAMETLLGWVIMGKNEVTENEAFSTTMTIQNHNIADLWKLETIGIMDPCETDTSKELEKVAFDHFAKTAKIDPDGRYEVKLPWMRDVEELSNNRDIAGRRLVSTSMKLFNNNRFQSYDEVFIEWKAEGFIEDSIEGPGHYLPHRGVFKANSTTQVRPVFDASCRSRGNLSLNDCLMKGPNLLELIPAVLLRFRLNEVGVISDIKKAFLQISVANEDRRYLKFLWWEDKNRTTTKVYQHARLVFGLNCSPFLLGAVIHHHLCKYMGTSVQDIAMKLKESFYVDNCVSSVKSKQELLKFIKISTELMASAKFELRGWEFSGDTSSYVPSSVLGLMWDKSKDVLFCDVSALEVPIEKITRRVILSMTNQIFDPLGFTCPATLCPKLLLQESWQHKLSWDSEVSEDMKKKFLNWVKDVKMLNSIKIPRRVCDSDESLSLHVFSDASSHSYASVVFLRGQVGSKVTVQLVMAKSRIAPLKQITIPRLELLSCVIGARLAEFVKGSLNLKDLATFFWTDSTTVLHWLRRDEAWSVFVRNRIKEIHRLSNIQDWKHVPGDLNPADLPSRGCSVSKLLSSRWWEGPSWLLLSESEWPKSDPPNDGRSVLEEKLKVSVVLVNNPSEPSNMFHFSSYTKTIRVVAWVLRFFRNVYDPKDDYKKGNLSPLEICEAEDRIIKMIQDETLTQDLVKNLKTLNVFKDKRGLYRIKSKLIEREDTEDFRYPVLLPGKHRLVELLIQECHLKTSHAGVQILLSKLREKFWILNGRRSVRRQINKCVKCKRYNAKNIETVPIGLPEDRIKNASVFEVVGIDLAGPLYLKGGEKCWIVLFTCAVYRAIHLELVLSLSTKCFLLSLRRFIARRGRPKVIYSDNGTNFVGAENLLQSLDWKIIEDETSMQKITWKFSPPSAPWWGGFWERMVQMVKNLLKRVLGKSCVYYEEMISILCDCEAIVNSRPLTYVSEDANDLVPLTPSMFLQDLPTVGVPDLDELDKIDVKKRWKHQQMLREHLRTRFRREYLGILLQPRGKSECSQVSPGDVVLIENDSKKKLLWPMAKVIKVYPSKDKSIRVVRLKTSFGEIIRPVRKIYPLEIRSPANEFEFTEKETIDSEVIGADTSTKGPIYTKSGRMIKLPARFLDS